MRWNQPQLFELRSLNSLFDRSSISEASTLEALEAILAAFDGCGLKRTAKTLCFARGSTKARLMLIGEAPGRDEDLQGKPFVGRAGQLLDRMLAAIGLDESSIYITNTVYWRPPGNRTPTPEEIEACAPFLDAELALLREARQAPFTIMAYEFFTQACLERLLRHRALRESMGREAVRRANRYFTWASVAEDVAALYEETLTARSRVPRHATRLEDAAEREAAVSAAG